MVSTIKRHRAGASILIVALGCALALGLHAAASEPVYTVAQVQRGLASHPRQWINRTILVRGIFRYAMSDAGTIDIFHPPAYIMVTYALYQPGPARMGGISGLPLVLKLAPHLAAPRIDPLAAILRQVPWLQHLIGSPDATYSIFRITPLEPQSGTCAGQLCPDAQLEQQPFATR